MNDPRRSPRRPLEATLQARLGPRVQALLSPRLGWLPPLEAELRGLEDDRDQLRARLHGLDRRAAALASDLELLGRPSFSAEMTIDQVWRRHPGARFVFARHHLPACDGCSVRFDESLEEATAAYGIDLAGLLMELDALLAPSG